MRISKVVFRRVTVAILIFTGVSAGYCVWSKQRLQTALLRIERAYGGLFTLIERNARDIRVERYDSLADMQHHHDILEQIKGAMPKDAVYWATWSSDGRHGLEGLNPDRDGSDYSSWGLVSVRDATGNRTLAFGSSNEGHSLYVLRLYFPKAVKRWCQIAFLSEKIDSMEETTAETRANKTDAGNGSKAICRVSNVHPSPSPDP
jgi:hypothetical protein